MAIPYLVDELTIESRRATVKAHPDFGSKYLGEDFYVEYEADVSLEEVDEAILLIPFLLNVLPLVWLSGDAYRVRALDAELIPALEEIRQAFQRLYPNHSWNGQLIPDAATTPSPTPESHRIALQFSGGVDSLYSSLKHRETRQVLITILSYLGQDWQQSEQTAAAAKAHFRKLSAALGQESIFVVSNLLDFIPPMKLAQLWPDPKSWLLRVQLGLGFTGLSAPLMGHLGIRKLLLANGASGQYGYPVAMHPDVVNSIRWSGGRVLVDGLERRRQEKLHFVRSISAEAVGGALPLKPCLYPVRGFENCCKCSKCLRTIVGIMADGGDPRAYGFDTDPCLALSALRKQFSSHRVYIRYVPKLLQWHEIQMAMRAVMSSPRTRELPVWACMEDLLWFSRFDLDQYFVRYHRGFRRTFRKVKSRLGLLLESRPTIDGLIRRVLQRLRSA